MVSNSNSISTLYSRLKISTFQHVYYKSNHIISGDFEYIATLRVFLVFFEVEEDKIMTELNCLFKNSYSEGWECTWAGNKFKQMHTYYLLFMVGTVTNHSSELGLISPHPSDANSAATSRSPPHPKTHAHTLSHNSPTMLIPLPPVLVLKKKGLPCIRTQMKFLHRMLG